jgi:hypothetical protein
MDGWWTVTASGRRPSSALLPQPFSWIDHLICPQQQRRRDREAERHRFVQNCEPRSLRARHTTRQKLDASRLSACHSALYWATLWYRVALLDPREQDEVVVADRVSRCDPCEALKANRCS